MATSFREWCEAFRQLAEGSLHENCVPKEDYLFLDKINDNLRKSVDDIYNDNTRLRKAAAAAAAAKQPYVEFPIIRETVVARPISRNWRVVGTMYVKTWYRHVIMTDDRGRFRIWSPKTGFWATLQVENSTGDYYYWAKHGSNGISTKITGRVRWNDRIADDDKLVPTHVR